MTDKPLTTSPQDTALKSRGSDDFELPIAPPSLPPRTKAGAASPSVILTDLTSQASQSTPTAAVPTPNSTVTVQDPGDGSDGRIIAPGSGPAEESTSNGIVAWLVCAIIVLLMVIVIQANQPSGNEVPPVVVSHTETERELVDARKEIDIARNESAQLASKVKSLEERLDASRLQTEVKVANLVRENKALEKGSSELSAEVLQLKAQVQNAPRPGPAAAPNAQPVPEPRQEYLAYRVAGLLAGDALNIRSGPGVNYPTVISLQDGVDFLVIGAAKMNGSDAWLPCIKVVNWTDPATGVTTTLNKSGWINSKYIERSQN